MAKTLNWTAIQGAWEAGKSVVAICSAYRCKADALKARAKAKEWDCSKRSDESQNTRTCEASKPAKSSVAYEIPEDLEPEEYLSQHKGDWQGLRDKAVKLMANLPEIGDMNTPKLLASIAGALKLVQDGQRKALGVDKPKDQQDQNGDDIGVIKHGPRSAEDIM